MNSAIVYASNCILGIIMVLFCMLTLKMRWGRAVTFIGAYAVVLFSFFGLLLLPDQNIAAKQTVGFLIDLIGFRILFTDKMPRLAICTFTIFMNEWICEFISFSFFSNVYPQTTQGMFLIPPLTQVSMYAIYICVYAFLMWIFSLLLNRILRSFSWQDILSYIFFPFMQLAMVTWGSLPNFYNHAEAVRLCIILFCIISDVGLYYSMRGITQRAELRASNALLLKQVDAEKEHYAALTEQYEAMRRMRHDIANHLYTIQALLDNGDTKHAAEYAKEILPRPTFHSSLGSCENPVVDAFLYSRMSKLKAAGISAEADVRLPAETSISNADMIIAFGNMLDNAEDACRALPEGKRYMRIQADIKNGCCTLRMENSVAEQPVSKKERIPGLNRGVGLSILERLAEQYRGTFTYGLKNSRFCAVLTMQTSEVK